MKERFIVEITTKKMRRERASVLVGKVAEHLGNSLTEPELVRVLTGPSEVPRETLAQYGIESVVVHSTKRVHAKKEGEGE
jgi:hypothetical protein